jgi:RNase P subunit RPR2
MAKKQKLQHKRRNFKNARSQEALARIDHLWKAANILRRTLPSASRNYVLLLRKIAMRVNQRLDRDGVKRHICRRCGSVLQLGENAWVRVRSRRLVVHCANCGAFRRFPLGPTGRAGETGGASVVVRSSAFRPTLENVS